MHIRRAAATTLVLSAVIVGVVSAEWRVAGSCTNCETYDYGETDVDCWKEWQVSSTTAIYDCDGTPTYKYDCSAN